MCKEMPVIPVDRVVDKKRIIQKMEGRGGEAQGVADTPPPPQKKSMLVLKEVVRQNIGMRIDEAPSSSPSDFNWKIFCGKKSFNGSFFLP
jgi:hypothetical protein